MHVSGHVASSGISVGVNEKSANLGYQYYGAGTHQLIYNEIWVNHDQDGSKTAILSWWFNSAIGSWSGDGALPLTKINRYPILNSASNFKDNENPVYNITAFGTYTIKVKLEAGGNSQLVTRTLSSKNSQTYTLQLTEEERTTLRNLMTGDSLNVRMTVCAIDNGNEISWSHQDVKMIKGSHYVKVQVNGVWKDAIPYVRVNGTWKEAVPYIRVNGTWKEGI